MKMGRNLPVPDDSRILIYQSESGETRLKVRLQDETVWLTQRLLAELYQVSVKTVNEHLINIYAESEINSEATIRKFRIVQTEGTRRISRMVDHYNLDAILAVGYRVRSDRGTAFRKWATVRLREYIVKGFTLDDERLKGGQGLVDYFDELLARIREIRASETRVYQRIREIFALAPDYHEGEEETQIFFATMQNIHRSDWEIFLDKFLRDTELPVLSGPGMISHEEALDWAYQQYDTFVVRRRLAVEAEAETRYMKDLRSSIKTLETKRKKPAAKDRKNTK